MYSRNTIFFVFLLLGNYFEDELKDEYFKKFDELDTNNRIIKNDNELKNIINLIKSLGFNISFTNGCFDIIH